MQEHVGSGACSNHSLAEVHGGSVESQHHVPLLGEELLHFCQQPDKFHDGAHDGPAALAPQHEDVVGA